jgi:hypothetical protein
MKLTRVTITGADDGVDPGALIDLSASFQFVEWGLLGSDSRRGTTRYPSDDWMRRFIEARGASSATVSWAMHLCGYWSRLTMAGADGALTAIRSLAWRSFSTPRVQLNGFSKYRLPMLALAKQMPEFEFILQCQHHDALVEAGYLHLQHHNTSVLWDTSGGRGVDDGWADIPYPANREAPKYGWAGGITEHNIVAKIEQVLRDNDLPALRDAECWLDLETGARTDDRFDLDKVRRVLELAKPFVAVT